VSATWDEPPPASTVETVTSSVAPRLAEDVPADNVTRRSDGTAPPPEPPPPPPPPAGGGGGAAAPTVKLPVLAAVPPGVVTLTGPVTAPAGTVAERAVLETSVKPAGTPPNATAVAPPRLVPPIVTRVPTGPLVGAIEVIAGAGGGGA
jgi:hypothetical protein